LKLKYAVEETLPAVMWEEAVEWEVVYFAFVPDVPLELETTSL
jgi:hypothetical protein